MIAIHQAQQTCAVTYSGIPQRRKLLYSSLDWNQRLPIVQKTNRSFGISNHIGIPPCFEHPKTGKHTRRALVGIGIAILGELPAADSFESALCMLSDVMCFLQDESNKAISKVDDEIVDRYHTYQMITNGPALSQLPKNCRGMSFIKHIVFMGDNGSIQIAELPSPNQMVEILQNDEVAQKNILLQQPLIKRRETQADGVADFQIESIDELYDLLHSQQRQSTRIGNDGDTDPNKIIRNAFIDFPRHIKAGRIKVVLDKAGSDGKLFWQSTHNSFYTKKRNIVKEMREIESKVVL